MDGKREIRWKQRFENYEKAYVALEKYVDMKQMSELEQAGVIQLFETCFELAWKVLKDYLEYEGILVKTPREALKRAYGIELIMEGEVWLTALDSRNLTAHIYDRKKAEEIINEIRESYFPLLKDLYHTLKVR